MCVCVCLCTVRCTMPLTFQNLWQDAERNQQVASLKKSFYSSPDVGRGAKTPGESLGIAPPSAADSEWLSLLGVFVDLPLCRWDMVMLPGFNQVLMCCECVANVLPMCHIDVEVLNVFQPVYTHMYPPPHMTCMHPPPHRSSTSFNLCTPTCSRPSSQRRGKCITSTCRRPVDLTA